MRSRNKIYNTEGIYFITSTIVDWIEVFNSQENFQILVDCINFYIENKKLKLYAYVIMPNHFHMVCKSDDLSKIIGGIKSFSAKKIIEKLQKDTDFVLLEKFRERKKKFKTDRTYQIWQETFYPKEILNEAEMKQKIDYIHYNPVKKGYCSTMVGWIYSSAKFYETGEEGLVKIERIV